MIKILKGERIESDIPNRITFEYTVRLYDAIDIAFIIFRGNIDNKIVWPHSSYIHISDPELYEDLRLMLTRRFERDTQDIKE